jgi:hypothetical protein
MPDYYLGGAWTGTELLITGLVPGDEASGLCSPQRGAAYNPATGIWRTLPPMPEVAENGEGWYLAVWTGRELLAGGLGLHAAHNPRPTGGGRCPAGSLSTSTVVVWTGRQILTWGGGCCGGTTRPARPHAGDRLWAPPPGPLAGRHTTGAWTGTEMVVVGGSVEGIFRDAAAYTGHPFLAAAAADARTACRRDRDLTGTEDLVVGGAMATSSRAAVHGWGWRTTR